MTGYSRDGYTTVVCHLCNQEMLIPDKLMPELILPYECNNCRWPQIKKMMMEMKKKGKTTDAYR